MTHSRYITSNIGIWNCTCKRCGHNWTSKRINEPYCCPNCKSKKWKEPKSPLYRVSKDVKKIPGHKYGRDSSQEYYEKFLGVE